MGVESCHDTPVFAECWNKMDGEIQSNLGNPNGALTGLGLEVVGNLSHLVYAECRNRRGLRVWGGNPENEI